MPLVGSGTRKENMIEILQSALMHIMAYIGWFFIGYKIGVKKVTHETYKIDECKNIFIQYIKEFNGVPLNHSHSASVTGAQQAKGAQAVLPLASV